MNQQLLERVLRSPRLPSLPTIAIEVIDLVQQKDVNIRQIANTISHDPALSSKILKTVNSSFYGQTQQISTISHALVILGLNSVKTLALGFSLVGNLKDSSAGDFDHLAFWKRSLYTAAAARAMARETSLVQQEEIFLGGLLQDLGLLAMVQTIGSSYIRMVASTDTEHRKLLSLERETLQTDHAEVGSVLAETWKLPPVLIAPIRYHEEPDKGPEDLKPVVRCVALGNRVADVFMSRSPGGALDQYYQLAQAWFGISRERAEPLLKDIHKNTVEMRHLFDLPTGNFENSEEILGRANEALLQLSLQQQQKSTELEQQNRELAEQVATDPLTGAANRRRFNQFIAQQFELSRTGDGPLSVLFLDTDHFKHFNDTYGHQTGDRVLISLVSVLQKHMPAEALVARYGGEEFAVVLPKTERIDAATLAESVRQVIQKTPIDADDDRTVNITVSIGVATNDGHVFERVEQLVRCADQAVYAAKAAGRNCVRVFVPRAKPQSSAA